MKKKLSLNPERIDGLKSLLLLPLFDMKMKKKKMKKKNAKILKMTKLSFYYLIKPNMKNIIGWQKLCTLKRNKMKLINLQKKESMTNSPDEEMFCRQMQNITV